MTNALRDATEKLEQYAPKFSSFLGRPFNLEKVAEEADWVAFRVDNAYEIVIDKPSDPSHKTLFAIYKIHQIPASYDDPADTYTQGPLEHNSSAFSALANITKRILNDRISDYAEFCAGC